MTTQQIQSKIDELRTRWLKEPDNRKIIEIQGKLLKEALKETDQDKKTVIETLY